MRDPQRVRLHGFFRALTCTGVILAAATFIAQRFVSADGSIVLTTLQPSYSQDFNSPGLVSSGTSEAVPLGWAFVESGTNADTTYSAGTGSSAIANTYSFGQSLNADRALGALHGSDTNTFASIFGASFTNGTGGTIDNLGITYRGEQWRAGATGRDDRLDFQYSLDATGLTDPLATWIHLNDLDFSTLVRANGIAQNGNTTFAVRSGTITAPIAHAQTFWLRWVDVDAVGNDDGLAIDDFSLTLNQTSPAIQAPTATPATLPTSSTPPSNTTALTVVVTPGLVPTSTGLQVTVDLTSVGGAAAQPMLDDGLNGDLRAGDGTYAYRLILSDDVQGGQPSDPPRSLPVSVTDAQNRSASAAISLRVNQTNPRGAGVASPATLAPGDNVLFTVRVTPGLNPLSADLQVLADLSPLGGPSQQPFFDDGTHGDAVIGDEVFSYGTTLPGALPPGPTCANPQPGRTCLKVNISDAQGRSTGLVETISFSVTTAIHDIQGPGPISPLAGASLPINGARGIVTAVTSDGFFMQARPAGYDNDPLTSEGIFVFTPSVPTVAVGAVAWVFGSVQEAVPESDPTSPSVTRIADAFVIVVSNGNPLPPPVALSADLPSAAGALDQLEPLEGMRVGVNALRVAGPAGATIDEPAGASTSNGVFFGVVDGVARPFQEPGIAPPDVWLVENLPNVPRFDGNPERLRVDTRRQLGAIALDVPAGALVTNVTGPLDFAARTYTIVSDAAAPPTVVSSIDARPVRAPRPEEFTVASLNLGRFFDTSDDAGDDVVLSADAFESRMAKASLVVRDVLRLPDIVGVQEVENLATLQGLAQRINGDVMAAGGFDPRYGAYLMDGHDATGLDLGLLVKFSRIVEFPQVEQVEPDAMLPDSTGFVFDRPPLVMRASIGTSTRVYPVTAIVVDLLGRQGIGDPLAGEAVRMKRKVQAETLAAYVAVASFEHQVVLVGNFNAFEFNDGYVDVLGTIKGTPAPADQVLLPTAPGLVNPPLVDFLEFVPPDQRYSVVSAGNAQQLDHVLVSSDMSPLRGELQYARSNADFPGVLQSDATRPERLSEHDMVVAYFSDSAPPMLILPKDMGPVEATSSAGAQANFVPAPSALDAVDGPRGVSCEPASGATFPIGRTNIHCMASDLAGNTATGTFHVTVVDSTPPVVTVPESVSAEATGPLTEVTFIATATDSVDGAVTPVCAPASGSSFAVGSTQVVCTATDVRGNAGQAAVMVIVTDTTPPVLSLPPPIVAVATSPAGAVVEFLVSASDLVSGAVTPVCTAASGFTFPMGATTTVQCSAIDARGNTGQASFTVSVEDPSTVGRMTGGARLEDGRTMHQFDFIIRERATGSESGTFEYRRIVGQRGGGLQDRFVSTEVDSVAFFNEPGMRVGSGRRQTTDTVVCTGAGAWNGDGGYTFVAQAVDIAEPGRGRDTIALTVYNASGKIVLSVSGTLTAGNIQSSRVTP